MPKQFGDFLSVMFSLTKPKLKCHLFNSESTIQKTPQCFENINTFYK